MRQGSSLKTAMVDRSFIGLETPEMPIEVEKGRIRQFAAAISESNPIYFDDAAALAAGHPAILAPPTFGFTLSILHPQTFDFKAMGLELARILHAEQRFNFGAPIHAGDVIRVRARITDTYEKKDGLLEFVCMTTFGRNQHDQPVFEMTGLIACRRTQT
jgi:acyl dehydratase